MTADSESPARATLIDYLRLFRIPNVFTSLSDVAMGYLFVASVASLPSLVCLLLASGLLYTAGMILNDVYDVEVDRQERPHRPIPSGKIPLGRAKLLGYGMLLGGIALATMAGQLTDGENVLRWRPLVISLALAACIVLYDAIIKRTPLAPIAMGACRFFNVLLGMSVAAAAADWHVFDYTRFQLAAAAGIGVYIVGVTWFARTEARQSNQYVLAASTLLMLCGVGLLQALYLRMSERVPNSSLGYVYIGLLTVVGLAIAWRCFTAVVAPAPQMVQRAVKHCIFSLIALDALAAWTVAPWYWALAIFALLAPTMLVGKWVYST